MKSSSKLYKPRHVDNPPKNLVDDTSEWTTVQNTKTKKPESKSKVHEKKRRNLEYRLNKTINEYLDKSDERNSKVFVMNLLDKNIQVKAESKLKYQLNKILSELEKNYESIKTARSFGYFNKVKGYVDNNINKLNKLVNEENFHLHIGSGLLLNSEGELLSELDEYKDEMEKYNKHLQDLESKKQAAEEETLKKLEAEKAKTVRHVIKADSAKIQTGKSFASLFK